jgi:hypothetical protein
VAVYAKKKTGGPDGLVPSCFVGPWESLAAYVASAVMTFVAMEVFRVAVPAVAGPLAGVGVLAVIAVLGMVGVVDVAVEVLGAMEPGADSDEDAAAGEPLWAVVAVGSAGVGRDFIVSVGACWCDADDYAYLGLGSGRGCYKETQTGNRRCCKDFETAHWVSPLVIREGPGAYALCGDVIVAEGDVGKRLPCE